MMQNSDYSFIQGGVAKDERGQIRFVNAFDMTQVKRFYLIKNADLQLIRGWRGHKIEQRWFYAISGSFRVRLVQIDNWGNPAKDLEVTQLLLTVAEGKVLHVPAGYATAFQANENNSELLVFADYAVEHALLDNHLWPSNYFTNNALLEVL